MSARTTPHVRWGHDLSTVEGSTAYDQEYHRRKAIAEDFYSGTFGEIEDQLDELDKLIVSVLTDLANDDDMKDTAFEVAKIARAAYIVRGMLPSRPEADDDEPSDVHASEQGPIRDPAVIAEVARLLGVDPSATLARLASEDDEPSVGDVTEAERSSLLKEYEDATQDAVREAVAKQWEDLRTRLQVVALEEPTATEVG